MGAQLLGVDRLVATIGDARTGLMDMADAHQAAGRIITAAASASAPRRTGRLAGSGRVKTRPARTVVEFAAPYAAVIHWGWRARNIEPNEFASQAAQRTEPQWRAVFENEVADLVGTITGV